MRRRPQRAPRIGWAGLVASLAFLATMGPNGTAVAQETDHAAPVAGSHALLVLPFDNLTGSYDAYAAFLPGLYERLTRLGVRTVRHDQLRGTLRKHRIRGRGRLSLAGSRVLLEEFAVRHVLLGSLDIYRTDAAIEVGLSARILDLEDGKVLGAWSRGAAAQQTARVFGTGRAETADELLGPVLDEMVDAIFRRLVGAASMPDVDAPVESATPAPDHTNDLVALVPLNDHSDRPYAARIVQNLLLSALVSGGVPVVEPGYVEELFLDAQTTARGGINLPLLARMREELGVGRVLTGEVETFDLSPVAQENAVPRVAYGLRLIDADTGRLTATLDLSDDGLRHETLFGRGRVHSMTRLCHSTADEVLRWLERSGRTR